MVPCPRPSLIIIQPEAAQKHGSAKGSKLERRKVYIPFLHDQHVYLLKYRSASSLQVPEGPITAVGASSTDYAGLSPERGTAGHSGLAGSFEASLWTARDRWWTSVHPSPSSHRYLAVQKHMNADGHGRRRSSCLRSLSGCNPGDPEPKLMEECNLGI